jgi:hypothetical protein
VKPPKNLITSRIIQTWKNFIYLSQNQRIRKEGHLDQWYQDKSKVLKVQEETWFQWKVVQGSLGRNREQLFQFKCKKLMLAELTTHVRGP